MIRCIPFGWLLLLTLASPGPGAEWSSRLTSLHDRVWLGPELWANPMEDWRLRAGRLECVGGGNRNVHVLTRQLGKKDGTFTMSVRLGRLDTKPGSAGFRIGIQDEIDDYRVRLVYGQGMNVGVNSAGELFIAGLARKSGVVSRELLDQGLELQFDAQPKANDYACTLTLRDLAGKEVARVEATVGARQLVGNLALVNNHLGPLKAAPKKKAVEAGEAAAFWFADWKIDGTKVEAHDEQTFGPILWSMHTLSRGVLKLTAQMPPLGEKEAQTVRLQLPQGEGWRTVAEEKIHPLARTATFRLPDWDARTDVRYRLAYTQRTREGQESEAYWTGTVRKDPVHKDTLVLAALSCIADFVYPNRELVRNMSLQDPDLLFFAGDQIYEQAGGYGIIRLPVDRAVLNYLRKWYLFGWSFRELMCERPTITIPDDHDVYQGNIWGNGGNPISFADHAAGGYVMHRDFVDVVHRTQTGHLPDPYDPTPMQQSLSVYYGPMVYGRVGFAILADRMFKSGPQGTVATWEGRPDHLKDPKIDVKKLDKPGLQFLGERQEKFLKAWAADWKGVDLKCVLSQTNFCNVANYHGAAREFLIADLDSGGWPQTPRNRAVDLMRRGFALHVCGDQHLTSLVHYGIDEPGDGNLGFCVPAGANIYPCAWQPDKEGIPVKNRPVGGLPNTGDYRDGLGNAIRVLAVGNPEDTYRKPRLESMHDKACGHGIIRFHRKDQTITLESCAALLADVSRPGAGDQFPGWPRTIKMLDSYGRKPAGYLPTIVVEGIRDPVLQIIDAAGEAVYTLRVKGDRIRPAVFTALGVYTVQVSDPETGRTQVVRDVRPDAEGKEVLRVTFR